MKRGSRFLLPAVLAAAVLTMGLSPQESEDAGEDERGAGDKSEYPFTPGSLLELDFEDGGSAVIRGWDKPVAEVVYSSWSDEHRSGEKRTHEVRVRSDEKALRISARYKGPRSRSHSLEFEIRVPKNVKVEFYSGGGGLDLYDLEGTFEGRTGGGGFTLERVNGKVHLRSGGGGIEVRQCRLDGTIQTGGGEVILEDVVGDLEATSGGGEVRYSNVRTTEGDLRAPRGVSEDGMTVGTVVISTAGGGIDVDRAPEGAKVSTGGGDIEVRGAARFVDARTGGGDIEVSVRDGWVRASTGAGDLDIEVENGFGEGEKGIDALTGMGDVTLILPPGASMELDLEIGYTRNSGQDFEIESDFDLDIERTSEWDYEHGSPRKFIRGTAQIGGAEHRVRVRTVNGNIKVRRGR